MARIEKVELRMVDLVPKVKRTDAIQSFVSQETPIVTITDSDGATGTGYSYTIGTGGSSVMRLLADHLTPRLIGRDADRIEAIWHELEFATHATTIGPITAIALAAIDTALWDLRARKQALPLWKLAGGAKEKCPLYTTEGGWLHIETQALVDDAVEAKSKGFLGSKVKIGRPRGLIGYIALTDEAAERVGTAPKSVWRHILRPRTILYTVLWAGVGMGLIVALFLRPQIDVSVTPLRNPTYVVLSDGSIRNSYDLRLRNTHGEDRYFHISLTSDEVLRIALEGTAELRILVPANETLEQRVHVIAPARSHAADEDRTALRLWIEDLVGNERVSKDTIFNGKDD